MKSGGSRKRVKRELDVNEWAHQIGKRSTESQQEVPAVSPEVSRYMAALGRIGGKKGGKSRLVKLTQQERSEIAYKAAQARWAKRQGSKLPSLSAES